MSEEIDLIEDANEADMLTTIQVCGELLCNLETTGLNLLPQEKLNLQVKLLKIINQNLDFLDYEQED